MSEEKKTEIEDTKNEQEEGIDVKDIPPESLNSEEKTAAGEEASEENKVDQEEEKTKEGRQNTFIFKDSCTHLEGCARRLAHSRQLPLGCNSLERRLPHRRAVLNLRQILRRLLS